MPTRRELLKTGLAGMAVLALANCGRAPAQRSSVDAGDRIIIAAIADAMLEGALPFESQAHAAALAQAVRGFDVAVAGLPPSVQGEVKQLLGLLGNPFLKPIATGLWSDWSHASRSDVAAFLQRWRFSNLQLLRSGFDALHQLIMAGWYGNNDAWPRIQYPGPPTILAKVSA